jgi:hypothetical protein
MAQVYTVTASTSVVLVSTVGIPNTIVYLSSVSYPGHIVGIRDTTGSPALSQQPIIVSTLNGVKFFDGSISTVITTPLGSIVLSSKSPTTWQILNNQAYQTSLSNAYLNTLTSRFSYINILSTMMEQISTSIIGNIAVTRSIQLGGTTQIVGDITVGGNVDFFSTLDVFEKLTLSTNATVAGDFNSFSSVAISGPITIGGYASTANSLFVGHTLQVDQCVSAEGALLPKQLSVQTLFLSSMSVLGKLRTADTISTQSNVSVNLDLTSLGSTVVHSSLRVQSNTYVGSSLSVSANFQSQILSTLGTMSIGREVSILGGLTVQETVSSFGTTLIQGMTAVNRSTTIGKDTYVRDLTRFTNLTTIGYLSIDTVFVEKSMVVGGDALSYGNTLTVSDLSVYGVLGVGKNLEVQAGIFRVDTGISTLGSMGVGETLRVQTQLFTGQSLTIGTNALQTSTSGTSSYIGGNVSTGFLDLNTVVLVKGDISVRKILGASTLGAPVDLQISTLSLSNTFRIDTEASIPVFDMNSYPDKIFVGPAPVDEGAAVTVDGILQNATTITQTNISTTTGTWWGEAILASTFAVPRPQSTSIFGPVTTVKPFLTQPGVMVTGDFLGLSSFFYSSNVSTTYTPGINGFVGGSGYKVASDGTSNWVAVGSTLSAQTSILFSQGGYQWLSTTAGGFTGGGQNIAYGGGVWVATGTRTGYESSIQYSMDGRQWMNASGAFPRTAYGAAFNGSNQWVAVGVPAGLTFGSAPGIKYSANGITWQDATFIPPFPFTGGSVAYGNNQWIVTEYLTSTMAVSVDGMTFSYIGTGFNKTSLAYNGSYWVAGGLVLNGDPTTTLLKSLNGLGWAAATSGGFTDRCEDVAWDSNHQVWYATGYNNPPSTNALYYSSDGENWSPVDLPSPGYARGVAVGTLFAPDTDKYLTWNMNSIVYSTLSSSVLYVSTLRASTLQSEGFTGDGAGLSNVTSFRPFIYTSSFQASNAYSLNVNAKRFETDYMYVADTINVSTNAFVSTVNIWVAAGTDSEPNGNIQTSFTGLNWTRGIGTTFDFYGKAVVGNCNAANPLYVAVGADSETLYTIQHSVDAKTWFPITQGGFDVEIDGIRQGNSVAYSSNLATWVAAGINTGTVSTLYYSLDVVNWFPGSNAFADTASVVAASPSGFVALGTSGVKYSPTGIQWYDSATSIQFTTVGYGKIGPTGGQADLWLGFSNLDTYTSPDGNEWMPLAPGVLQQVLTSVVYGGSFWVGVGCNTIQYSSNGFNWIPVTTTFAPDTVFNTVAYNLNQNRWVAGAVSTTADKSLWSSSNLQDWLSAQSGGFSTSILTSGVGYGVFTSSLYTFAAGQASYGGFTPAKQAIFSVSTTGAGSYLTDQSLTLANTSNVFNSQVRGIYGESEQLYKYVAVGDGAIPQRTIARSLEGDPNTWIPAITGGFSTTGYAVTYYKDRWIALGDAQVSTNTIQYSPDGANWFGTNTAPALRRGGRGIGTGVLEYNSTLVAVGRDITTSTIAKSIDGYTWTVATGSYFQGQGNAVTAGAPFGANKYVAVGLDTRGAASTILQSADGSTWANIFAGGFSGGGWGIAYGLSKYVAVGVDSVNNKTIQYSSDGFAFNPVTSGGFTSGGYGIAFNSFSNLFFAVGEDLGALKSATIKYSGDALNWSNVSSMAGFQSQTTLGAAYGVFTQAVEVQEIIPSLEFSNLIVYERTEPLLYPKATIRLQSSFMIFNEALTINLSSQVIINSNVPYNESTVLTVYGNIYASSFLYTGSLLPSDTLLTSSLVMSTISSTQSLQSVYLTTPSLAINTAESKANFISSYTATFYNALYGVDAPANMININNVLFTTATSPNYQQTGIRYSTPMYDLDINGSFGVSSLSTASVYASTGIQFKQAQGSFFYDPAFSMVSGSEGDLVQTQNSILATPSSLLMNSVVSISLSSQKVGLYTNNPVFSLDVRAQTILQNLSTPKVNTSLLFLTLQSE